MKFCNWNQPQKGGLTIVYTLPIMMSMIPIIKVHLNKSEITNKSTMEGDTLYDIVLYLYNN